MTALAIVSPDGISDINNLYLENFYLNIDKERLELEVERLKASLNICKEDLAMYKFLLKEYQDLYNGVMYGKRI